VNRKIELLAPGGDADCIKAAIAAGADAVYCGLDKFNARNRAANIGFEDLQGIIRLAHQYNCKVFLTLNILVIESEIPALISLLNKLTNTGIDGVIVQDFGLFFLLANYFKSLQIHASTQLTTHNEGQIRFLSKLAASRVNLSRELNLQEIRALTTVAHQNKVLTEVFVHGSNCLSFSGICYLSSVHGANSGNRGRCSQPCRDPYLTTPAGKDFPLNLKDNSAWFHLKELVEAGVDSVKIEGRIKKFQYVYTVVSAWRKQLRNFYEHGQITNNNQELYKVFNRDFSNAYLTGNVGKSMFIDNPRDHSAIHRAEGLGGLTDENLEQAKTDLFYEKAESIAKIRKETAKLSIAKIPLKISISGKCGAPLTVKVNTPEDSFVVFSEINLSNTGTEAISHAMLMKRLKAVNETEYYIDNLDLENLPADLYIPFKELTSIKKRLIFILNGSRETIDPINVPVLQNHSRIENKPALLVLISSHEDLHLCQETTAEICFQLPNALKNTGTELIDLFNKNRNLIPWFPSVLIGEDYTAAVEFLEQVQPRHIITNNTGIAYEAWQKEIPWIAGPYLNLVNSFSLISLKENFNCAGAFISNEISKIQLQQIKKPAGFKLYFSIYHPIVLMTIRQCLFHQVTGCEKNQMDDTCISDCVKSATITNLKGVNFKLEKTKGNFNCIYNAANLLNTDVVTDLPELFTGFLIDLSEIKTDTQIEPDKTEIIRLFQNHLNSISSSAMELHQQIHPTTNTQYKLGI
jgi:putative protease